MFCFEAVKNTRTPSAPHFHECRIKILATKQVRVKGTSPAGKGAKF